MGLFAFPVDPIVSPVPRHQQELVTGAILEDVV